MRILLVEDNASFAQSIEKAIMNIEGCELAWKKSRVGALSALDDEPFDLVILDRKIPTEDEVLDDHENHGWDVFQNIRENQPGTPVWFLTGTEDADFASDLINGYARNEDLHACGKADSMYRVFWKRRMSECVSTIREFRAEVRAIDDIDISFVPDAINLRQEEERLVKLFGRRHEGSRVQIKPLTSGLSDARVLHLTVLNNAGLPVITSVAKIGTFSEIETERSHYHTHIIRLPAGTFPSLTEEISAGASGFVGIFYQVVGQGVHSLFDKLLDNPDEAAQVPRLVQQAQTPWIGNRQQVRRRVSSIRRSFIGDAMLEAVLPELQGIEIHDVEALEIDVGICAQHGDLHCANVLFDDIGNPMMIDYGETGRTFACVDAVVLELCTIFHKDAPDLGDWISRERSENWTDIDAFAGGSQCEAFLRACRDWALEVAVSPMEVWAVCYGYIMRQLKYEDTDKELARAVIQSCISALLNEN